uniref:Uncharacterized protein n=1 Tax=Arundo donax TaxID=35708 RepID=A0A0A8YBI1_ARUDO
MRCHKTEDQKALTILSPSKIQAGATLKSAKTKITTVVYKIIAAAVCSHSYVKGKSYN